MTASINTVEMLALTQWLKESRKSKKLSMRTLADSMNKPHSYVQKVEQGERRLDLVEFVWYCSHLGIDPYVGIELVQNAFLLRNKN